MKPLGTHLVAEFIGCSESILNDKKELEEALKLGTEKCGLGIMSLNSHQFDPVGVTVIAVISESHVAVHTYPEARHASVDVFTCSDAAQAQKLLGFLRDRLEPRTVRVIELLRGNPMEIRQKDWMTEFSPKGFEARYHIERNLFSKRSNYQQIDIIENEDFGRMLFLDKDLQIAEKDAHIYNLALISPLLETKNGLGRVAILGGGDGGVLHELLKYNPRDVVLVDIDEEVITASRRFLKSICKDALSDPKVSIVIDDASRFLEKGHHFDAIVYDLTMHPESLTRRDRTGFLSQLFSKIAHNLTGRGMVSLQCCSESDVETLGLLKAILSDHFREITFRTVFVPSFCENWIFASAKVKQK